MLFDVNKLHCDFLIQCFIKL